MTVEINILDLNQANAQKKAKAVEQLANNLDVSALEILAQKSGKPGMSDKVRRFKALM
ncbi:MAG: hypothetical protein R3279_05370 [Putridiphycobacter sp.]|nr:hypothetical protein [Putridiphycobacter sp.]